LATTPAVAIGQRALIVQTPAGNVMWDCITSSTTNRCGVQAIGA